MTFQNSSLYLITFSSALILSLILTPAARAAAKVLNIIDHPSSDIKTHKKPVPYLGGVAIFLAFSFSLLWIRIITSFPSGTLRSLRGILIGGLFIFIVGLVDDTVKHGLHYRSKLILQTAAAIMLMLFGIQIDFIDPKWFAILLSLLWIVGITNAFNLIDIQDGLASGVAIIAALAFLFISLPTEKIYVNFAAAALAGAVLGFLPYNISKGMRIFMGDSGSLFIGFVASSLALGTSYGGETSLVVFSPILILIIPIYDTLLVFSLRIQRGLSPFRGSKDHFPMRLEKLGWSRNTILLFSFLVTIVYSFGAFTVARAGTSVAVFIYIFYLALLTLFTQYVMKVDVR